MYTILPFILQVKEKIVNGHFVSYQIDTPTSIEGRYNAIELKILVLNVP